MGGMFINQTLFLRKTGEGGHLGGSASWASAFGSGREPRVLGSSPAWGSLLSGGPASPSAPPPAHGFFLSLSNE